MEFRKPDKKKKTPYCYFAVPDDDNTHSKIEGTVIEGMYWKVAISTFFVGYLKVLCSFSVQILEIYFLVKILFLDNLNVDYLLFQFTSIAIFRGEWRLSAHNTRNGVHSIGILIKRRNVAKNR